MDFVSAVLSLSQKRDARGNADSARASTGSPRDSGTRVSEGGGKAGTGTSEAEARARETKATKCGGEGGGMDAHEGERKGGH